MAKKVKSKKKKANRVEMVLYGVLSYPDLVNPKPYKNKIYYRTDILFDEDDPQLAVLQKKLKKVRVNTWGEDKSEWPKGAKKRFIQDGNEREDQKAYKDKKYVSVSTQTPVSVIDPKGKNFNPAMVKGGMFAKVAVCISTWDNEGDEGLSIYLQAIMVDTTKEKLSGFGGGKSAKQLFGLDKDDDDSEDEDSDGETHEDEDEDLPKGKKKKKPHDDDEDESDEDDDEDESDEDDDEDSESDDDEDDDSDDEE